MAADEHAERFYEFGVFRLDAVKRRLLRDGTPVPLTPKVFDTLLLLVENNTVVLEKDELIKLLWRDSFVEENNLTQNISALRKALGEKPGEHRFIVTVPGRGYRFVADVRTSEDVIVERGEYQVRQDEAEAKQSKHKLNGEEARESGAPEVSQPKIHIDVPKGRTFSALIAATAVVLGLGITALYLWRAQTKTPSVPSIKTIAVLPFKPLVTENRDEALEMGMADTLIARLGSSSREIIVRPLGSVRKYSGMEQDPQAAGRELGVESVLDGHIQRLDDHIRVTARLVNVRDGVSLWTGTFDERFTNVFRVQDAISERVTGALALQLSSDEKMRLAKRYTENTEAYQLHLKGRYHIFKLTPPEIQKGMAYFQQAIEIDPNYALAHVGLSDAYRSFALSGEIPATEVMPKAKAAANKALEIDDTLAEAHSSLSSIIFWYDWDWAAAEKHIKRALGLNPNNADAHFFHAYILSNSGRHAEALAEAKRAGELDPLSLVFNALEGQFLLHAGQPDEASAKLQKTFDLDSNFALAHLVAASVYIEKGMYREAVAEARRTRELNITSSQPIAYLCYALAKSGKQAEARDELEKLLNLSKERYVSPYTIGLIYNGLNERDEALAWLERGFEKRDPRMTFLKVEPKWNNLRSEPRFVSLLKRMNLE